MRNNSTRGQGSWRPVGTTEVDNAIYRRSYNVRVPHTVLLLSITNKMQRYTIFFITVNALHVSGGFCVGELVLTHASGSSTQAWHIPGAVCTVFELLMMGPETAWNMWSIDSNKEYCIKVKVKVVCGSYITAALRHIVLLPEWVPSFISRGAAHTKRRERPLLAKEGTIPRI